MNIEIGTQFRIGGNVYKNRTFTVIDINPTDSSKQFAYKCKDQNGDVHYFSQINFNYYGDKVRVISPKLENAKKALASVHVQSVEVAFEYEADGIRYYAAISRRGFEAHRYTVRLGEDTDGVRYGKCNCAAGALDQPCRHLAKAALLDTERTGQEIYLTAYSNYRAYRRAA